MYAFLADDLFAVDDAGAVDDAVQPAETVERARDGRLGARLVGDVGANELGARTQLRGQRVAFGFLEIGDDDLAAAGHEHLRRRSSQSRRAAGDEEYAVADLHRCAFVLAKARD